MKGIREENQLKPDFILAKTYTDLLKNLNDYAKLHGITRRYEEMVNDIYYGFASQFVIEYKPIFKEAHAVRAKIDDEIQKKKDIVKKGDYAINKGKRIKISGFRIGKPVSGITFVNPKIEVYRPQDTDDD